MHRTLLVFTALLFGFATPSATLAAVALVDFGRTHTQWVVAPDQVGLEDMIGQIATERGRARVVIQCNDPGWISFSSDSEVGARGFACGMEAAAEARATARQVCESDAGRQGYCGRLFTRYDDGTHQMEPTNTNVIDEMPDVDAAFEAAGRLVRAVALAEACSIKTEGEIGAPVNVIETYYAEATAGFSNRFGVPITAATDVDAVTAATRLEAEALLQSANRDVWPPVCDDALNGLAAASRGDFSVLFGPQ